MQHNLSLIQNLFSSKLQSFQCSYSEAEFYPLLYLQNFHICNGHNKLALGARVKKRKKKFCGSKLCPPPPPPQTNHSNNVLTATIYFQRQKLVFPTTHAYKFTCIHTRIHTHIHIHVHAHTHTISCVPNAEAQFSSVCPTSSMKLTSKPGTVNTSTTTNLKFVKKKFFFKCSPLKTTNRKSHRNTAPPVTHKFPQCRLWNSCNVNDTQVSRISFLVPNSLFILHMMLECSYLNGEWHNTEHYDNAPPKKGSCKILHSHGQVSSWWLPWYNHTGWLGVKHQLTLGALIDTGPFLISLVVADHDIQAVLLF